MANKPQYVTKKELRAHEQQVKKMIREAIKSVKEWDRKQDQKFILRQKGKKE